MRVAIIGRTATLLETAKVLIDAGHAIPLVISAKAAPHDSTGEERFRALAGTLGARYLSAAALGDELVPLVDELGPIDIAVSLNYPTMINQQAIDCFRLGILNAHGGDLPRYRGNASQAWALLNGETRIGLCIHRMVGGELDSGDVVLRRHLPVTIDTRIGEVQAWMARLVPSLFAEAVQIMEQPAPRLEPQNHAEALRGYSRRPEDGRIDWRRDRESILRLINASSEPYAGAYCAYRGDKLVVWRAALSNDDERYLAVPGQVSSINREDGGVDVITGAGRLRLLEIEWGGSRDKAAMLIRSTRDRLE